MFIDVCIGICGRTRIADVGGPPYLIPLPDLSKVKGRSYELCLTKLYLQFYSKYLFQYFELGFDHFVILSVETSISKIPHKTPM